MPNACSQMSYLCVWVSDFCPLLIQLFLYAYSTDPDRGWSGVAKVSCILRHQGIQLILAYSWAWPAILVAGKGSRGMLLFLLFLHLHSFSSFFPVPLFHLLYYLFYLFSTFLWEMTQNDKEGLTHVKPQHKQILIKLPGCVGWSGPWMLTYAGRHHLASMTPLLWFLNFCLKSAYILWFENRFNN